MFGRELTFPDRAKSNSMLEDLDAYLTSDERPKDYTPLSDFDALNHLELSR